jgi:DNA-binding transcriptional MerR regulator
MKSVGKSVVFTIGELARRTGLPVKTIRFYSDEGLLPPTDRTPAGYRLYDTAALARLELVRTLRELGLGLADVERALTRETTVPRLAIRHSRRSTSRSGGSRCADRCFVRSRNAEPNWRK